MNLSEGVLRWSKNGSCFICSFSVVKFKFGCSLFWKVNSDVLYGTTKIHKFKEKSDVPLVRPIVLSINSYNYNFASYLCELLTPFIPAHCTKDSFAFIKDIQEISTQDLLMVSYDVCSLFTNITLNCS